MGKGILLSFQYLFGTIFILFHKALPRSTNLIEAWHRGFQSTCVCHHPTIWKFIDFLKTEQGNVELKQLNLPMVKTPKKLKNQLIMKRQDSNFIFSLVNISVFKRS